jgi:DNA-binding SARP family transcriptional activator
MQLHNLIDQAYETFQKHAANAKIILLHPRSRYRSVLVARLINAQETPIFYYALGPDDTSVQSFLSGITHDIANQFPTFGRHLNLLPTEALADTDEHLDLLLDTFANDLAELSDQPFFLVLDEYDRCDSADDVQRFVEQLVSRLPDNCRLIINSRSLPRLPWVSMIARGSAVLLEDSHLIANDFYDVAREGTNNLEVYALGPGFVLLNGEPIDTWEGHLPRLLFFFALDRPIITRSEICEAFWPELEIDQAVNVFHVTKRRLHKALDMDVLVHDEGYYRINPELGVQYDIIDFVQSVMAGRNLDNGNQLEAWQRAIDQYRGPFLQGHSDRWIMDRRRAFQAGYLEALTETAKVRLAEGRAEYALGLFQRALAEDYSHEELHREIMRLYTQLGRRSEAAAHYQRYVENLKRSAKEPHPDTASLYQEIMS